MKTKPHKLYSDFYTYVIMAYFVCTVYAYPPHTHTIKCSNNILSAK